MSAVRDESHLIHIFYFHLNSKPLHATIHGKYTVTTFGILTHKKLMQSNMQYRYCCAPTGSFQYGCLLTGTFNIESRKWEGSERTRTNSMVAVNPYSKPRRNIDAQITVFQFKRSSFLLSYHNRHYVNAPWLFPIDRMFLSSSSLSRRYPSRGRPLNPYSWPSVPLPHEARLL